MEYLLSADQLFQNLRTRGFDSELLDSIGQNDNEKYLDALVET